MRKKFSWKKFWKRTLYAFLGFVGLIIIGMVYLYIVAIDYPPEPKDQSSLQLKRQQPSKGFYTVNNSCFRKRKRVLFEMYVEGKPFERGVINGKLSKDRVIAQKDHFVEQIRKIFP